MCSVQKLSATYCTKIMTNLVYETRDCCCDLEASVAELRAAVQMYTPRKSGMQAMGCNWAQTQAWSDHVGAWMACMNGLHEWPVQIPIADAAGRQTQQRWQDGLGCALHQVTETADRATSSCTTSASTLIRQTRSAGRGKYA